MWCMRMITLLPAIVREKKKKQSPGSGSPVAVAHGGISMGSTMAEVLKKDVIQVCCIQLTKLPANVPVLISFREKRLGVSIFVLLSEMEW